MAAQGRLEVPVIGVASSAGDDDFIHQKLRASIAELVPDADPHVVDRSGRAHRLRVRRLPRAGGVRRAGRGASAGHANPLFYLAIPPVAVRRRGPGPRPRRRGRRRAGSWSRSRSVATRRAPRELNDVHPRRVPRGADLPHRPLPRQGVGREPAGVPLRQLAARAGLEPQLHLQRADHHGRGLRRRGPRQVLRERRRAPRRRPEPPAPDRRAAGDGAAGRCRRHARCATRR